MVDVEGAREEMSEDYIKGVKDAAYLLAKCGMDDQPQHYARYLLKTLLSAEALETQSYDLNCEGCGWEGTQQEDILPDKSIYCPNCRRAVWPERYKFHKGDESWRS